MPAQIVLARFADEHALFAAARSMREAGHAGLDLHSPFPLEGASEALGLVRSRVPLATLIAGLTGAAIGYTMQLYCNAIDFPINVGNRPAHAALSFVPITFELAVLFAAFGALLSMLASIRLPTIWHPTQASEPFRSASVDGYWLSVPLEAGAWDPSAISEKLRSLGATEISIVAAEEAP